MIILIRLPVLYFWNNYLVGDDAALYMETAINYAEKKDYSASVLRHISDQAYLEHYIEANGIKDRMEWIPPLYIFILSLIYRLVDYEYFMISINIFNLLLFSLFILLYFNFLIKIFYDKPFVIIGSLLFIGFNFLIFEFIFGPHFEAIYLLTFLVVFLIHIEIIEYEKPWYFKYMFYPIVLSLFLFSKYSSIPFVGAFLFHFLYRKRVKDFVVISFLVFLIVAPWMFVRSYIISGHPLAQMIRGDFPFYSVEQYSGFASESFYAVYSFFREVTGMFFHYVSIDYFFFLLPFVLVYLIKGKEGNIQHEISILLFLFAIIFFGLVFRNANGRYQILLLLPIIPFAINELLDYLGLLKSFLKRRMIMGILMFLFISIQIFKITDFYNIIRNTGDYREKVITGSLELVERAGIPEHNIILTNVLGYNVFSKQNVVLTPKNVNAKNKYELLKTYNVQYVLFAEGESYLGRNIFCDLHLVDSLNKGIPLYLYKVAQ